MPDKVEFNREVHKIQFPLALFYAPHAFHIRARSLYFVFLLRCFLVEEILSGGQNGTDPQKI